MKLTSQTDECGGEGLFCPDAALHFPEGIAKLRAQHVRWCSFCPGP